MNIAVWVLFGIIADAVAHWTDEQEAKGGILGAIAFGVAGALIGGIVANFIFGGQLLSFDILALIIVICGTLAVLLIHRTVFLSDRNE